MKLYIDAQSYSSGLYATVLFFLMMGRNGSNVCSTTLCTLPGVALENLNPIQTKLGTSFTLSPALHLCTFSRLGVAEMRFVDT